jgi:hypothetical protein
MMTGPTALPATEAPKINADPLSFIQAKSSKEAVAAQRHQWQKQRSDQRIVRAQSRVSTGRE